MLLLTPLYYCPGTFAPTQDYCLQQEEKNSTDDHTDSHAVTGDEEDALAPFDNGLNNLEEVEAYKILDASLLPQKSVIWIIDNSIKHEEWKLWDLEQLLAHLSLGSRSQIYNELNATPEASLWGTMRQRTTQRLAKDDIKKWNHLQEDARKALADLQVRGIDGFRALSEECLQQYEKECLWNSCGDVTRSVLEWTWGHLPDGGYQNWGWRGVLRIVAVSPEDKISLI